MPSGVYKRTKETLRNSSKAMKVVGRGNKGKPSSFKGKHHSEESIAKMRVSHEGHIVSEETKRKIGDSNRGKIRSKEMRERYSKAKKGIPKSEEHKKNLGKSHLGLKQSKESKEKKKAYWQNPEWREKCLKAIFAGLRLRPTKPERKLKRGLNKLFPGEYKYVGDGNTFIGGKCPDFINVNGQKKIIEMFGNYWHSKEITGRTRRQEESQRMKHFAKYGFKTLIVWERELKDIKRLKKKIVKFQRELTS